MGDDTHGLQDRLQKFSRPASVLPRKLQDGFVSLCLDEDHQRDSRGIEEVAKCRRQGAGKKVQQGHSQQVGEERRTAEGEETMIFKRSGIYWCDFAVNGQRYRRSLETTMGREATHRERVEIEKAKNELLAAALSKSARTTFLEAFDAWLVWCRSGIGRKKPLSAKSLKTEKERGSVVKKVLGPLPVKKTVWHRGCPFCAASSLDVYIRSD